jgi:hypothetical protein
MRATRPTILATTSSTTDRIAYSLPSHSQVSNGSPIPLNHLEQLDCLSPFTTSCARLAFTGHTCCAAVAILLLVPTSGLTATLPTRHVDCWHNLTSIRIVDCLTACMFVKHPEIVSATPAPVEGPTVISACPQLPRTLQDLRAPGFSLREMRVFTDEKTERSAGPLPTSETYYVVRTFFGEGVRKRKPDFQTKRLVVLSPTLSQWSSISPQPSSIS